VSVGDDTPFYIEGIGSILIKTHDGMTRTLTGIKHIPSYGEKFDLAQHP
jgi:hypothetical protein